MNNDYLDYLAHGRTKGSKNGVSTTEGYTAIGKPAMSEAERRARAKEDYRKAKAKYKGQMKEASEMENSNWGFGIKGTRAYINARSKRTNATLDFADAKAKYAVARGKSEEKSYAKSMFRLGGLPGSAADSTRRYSESLYNRLSKTKGQDFADNVTKRVRNKAVAGLAGAGAVTLGAMAVNLYLNFKDN